MKGMQMIFYISLGVNKSTVKGETNWELKLCLVIVLELNQKRLLCTTYTENILCISDELPDRTVFSRILLRFPFILHTSLFIIIIKFNSILNGTFAVVKVAMLLSFGLSFILYNTLFLLKCGYCHTHLLLNSLIILCLFESWTDFQINIPRNFHNYSHFIQCTHGRDTYFMCTLCRIFEATHFRLWIRTFNALLFGYILVSTIKLSGLHTSLYYWSWFCVDLSDSLFRYIITLN